MTEESDEQTYKGLDQNVSTSVAEGMSKMPSDFIPMFGSDEIVDNNARLTDNQLLLRHWGLVRALADLREFGPPLYETRFALTRAKLDLCSCECRKRGLIS